MVATSPITAARADGCAVAPFAANITSVRPTSLRALVTVSVARTGAFVVIPAYVNSLMIRDIFALIHKKRSFAFRAGFFATAFAVAISFAVAFAVANTIAIAVAAAAGSEWSRGEFRASLSLR